MITINGLAFHYPTGELTSMGLNSLVFDPCTNVPEQGDFLSVMQENVNNLKSIFMNQ